MHETHLDIHRRHTPRLRGHDYSQAGAYFVTICAHERVCLFGEIVNCKMRLNGWGMIVRSCFQQIEAHFLNVKLDSFTIMPNHVHAIICLLNLGMAPNGAMPVVGARHASPLRPRNGGVQPGSLGAIVGAFKSAGTRMINLQRETPGNPVWQRNYYERIVRSEREFDEIREYIINNPAQWAEDEFNPENARGCPKSLDLSLRTR